MPFLRARFLSVLLALCLIAAACGGGGDDAEATEAADPDREATGVDDPGSTPSPGDDGPTASWETDAAHVVPDGDTTWDVELADDAIVLDPSVSAALIESDPATGTYVLPSDALDGTGLTEGDAVIFSGVGIGRVTEFAESGGLTTVHTEPASLADVIEDGTVAWDAPLDFSQGFIPDAGSGGLEPAAVRRGAPPAGSAPVAQLVSVGIVSSDGSERDVRCSSPKGS
ncbi:MAG: hypothetical protein JJE52_11270 [Acidimicrobiia bacterium]|nr:hypothetical protein [Acidimicrobiia bacterium]